MHVVLNQRLVGREARIGFILLGATFCLLLVGMYLSLQMEQWTQTMESWMPITMSYAIVLVGMVLFYVGNIRVRRFGPQHRQDGRLRALLKGLDDRWTLYAFAARKLPDYVLIGPTGVWVLTARGQEGEIICRADRWSRAAGFGGRIFAGLYGNPLGTPSHDTVRGVQQVKSFLESRLSSAATEEQVPVHGLVVLTGERIRLRTERCTVPAATRKELRKAIAQPKTKLSRGRLEELRRAFDEAASG